MLRCENYTLLKDAAESGSTNMSEQGNQILIPASFTSGPCYMVQAITMLWPYVNIMVSQICLSHLHVILSGQR